MFFKNSFWKTKEPWNYVTKFHQLNKKKDTGNPLWMFCKTFLNGQNSEGNREMLQTSKLE